MKGRCGQLFAKRQAMAASWAVGGGGYSTDAVEQPLIDDPTATSNASIQLKEAQDTSCKQHAGFINWYLKGYTLDVSKWSIIYL